MNKMCNNQSDEESEEEINLNMDRYEVWRNDGWETKHWRFTSCLTLKSLISQRKCNPIKGWFQSLCHRAAVNLLVSNSLPCMYYIYGNESEWISHKQKQHSMNENISTCSAQKDAIALLLINTWWFTGKRITSHVFVNNHHFTEARSHVNIHRYWHECTNTQIYYMHATTIILLFFNTLF